MDLTVLYKIAGVGILIAVINVFLTEAGKKDQAQMLSLAGVILVLVWLVQMIAQLFRDVQTVFHWW
ncbi:MAG TPA: stage III sporulation protein AC [Limnochordia bacterium]|nr:stage III sporulation protein AC [Limnochordia bacterium]